MPSTTPAPPPIRALATEADCTAQALSAIAQIAEATHPPALLEKLRDATAAVGANASLYTAAFLEGDREQCCFSLFAGHPAYAHAQNALGPLLKHPWFRFARTHAFAGSDRDIHLDGAADTDAVELARQYGFGACFIVPASAGPDRYEMLCLGYDEASDFEGSEASITRTLARSLAAELHDWLARYLLHRLRETARLQRIDLKLLALERQGLSTKDISILTGLSMSSVDSRFRRLCQRLNCASRRTSALRVSAYGLLEPTDTSPPVDR